LSTKNFHKIIIYIFFRNTGNCGGFKIPDFDDTGKVFLGKTPVYPDDKTRKAGKINRNQANFV
jgi:hypothetical protein